MVLNYTVKSILLYGAEIWGWTGMETQSKTHKISSKVRKNGTSILEEAKVTKLRIGAGRRVMKLKNI